MGRRAVLCALASVLALAPANGSGRDMDVPSRAKGPPASAGDPVNAVTGRLLVRFDEAMSTQQIDEINRRLGTIVINRMSNGKLLLVEVPYVTTLNDIRMAYEAMPGVKYAEPELIYKTQPRSAAPPGSPEPKPSNPVGIQGPQIGD